MSIGSPGFFLWRSRSFLQIFGPAWINEPNGVGVSRNGGEKMKNNLLKLGTILLMTGAMVMPVSIDAQTRRDREIERRDKTRDEWKNIATISGAAALLGLLTKDGTLTFAGSAGALYSLYRYDQDSRSRDRLARTRAEFFSRDHFYRNGVRYNRRTVVRGGRKYYQFYRAPRSQQDW